MSQIDKLLPRLSGVKSTGHGKWLARCPSHKDKSPSLALKEIDGDRILINCFAGCPTESVLSAVGLTFSDLFPVRIPDPRAPKSKAPKLNTYELFPLLVQESTILALACFDLLQGKILKPHDLQRVMQAHSTVMELHCEVSKK